VSSFIFETRNDATDLRSDFGVSGATDLRPGVFASTAFRNEIGVIDDTAIDCRDDLGVVDPNFVSCGVDANVEFRLAVLLGNSKKNVHSL
jgi:hypothetical protein